MALGATSTDILWQFVIESIVICCIGGICGIIVGVATPLIIGSLAKWPIAIAPISVVLASMITMLVGIFFGIYPAHKASQLKPVEALQEQ
jgi:ABC-type antimicrobial peptide transport system permease subunit